MAPVDTSEDLETTAKLENMRLTIVFMLVGCRDEIKSIILVGQELLKKGHRVRVATHSIFQSVVLRTGLEFFSLSNDAQHPIARNDSGLVPGLSSSDQQEVFRGSKMLMHTLRKCWDACTHPGPDKGKPFVADAIIATPLAHAHIHCAERLAIPLHIMSISPWSPTRRFAHPLAQIQGGSEVDLEVQNYISYLLVEDSLGHEIYRVIDHFRRFTLRLPKLSLVKGMGFLGQFNIPHTYLWSPSLLPKPDDWNNFIDISGHVATADITPFTPSEDLSHFLKSAKDPVLVLLDLAQLSNPDSFLQTIKDASLKYDIYFLLDSKFQKVRSVPDIPTVFVLDSDPIEWLMPKISVLFTSGQFSSINLGLKFGKPMITLPLLRDQPFWSAAIHKAGLGSVPILEADFFSEKFVEAFRYCMQQDVRETAERLSEHGKLENGTVNAVKSFYRHLQSKMVQHSPTATDSASHPLRRTPLVPSSIMSAVPSRNTDMSKIESPSYPSQVTSSNSIEQVKPTFLVEAKGVSRNLMKAIVKPTVSHIADAYNKLETQNDSLAAKAIQKTDLSKTDMAMKVAKNVGFGSAVACGKIALLPFKSKFCNSQD
ncbi:UDP-glucuronosyl/UDP-glucosyltransferase [Penicillium occitanis (nom. inval.)]|nr:UDP-glucuronosyl/UDP-glucosyltransferase [Penicillium occitanis (nom. inval.)]PCH05960.1 hypothetical protein PENOC_026010 [Penicillium occitanis (nom. inval.)]